MSKTKTTFFCQNCGYESPKWLGKCPSCAQWNTFVEEKVVKSKGNEASWREDRKLRHSRPVKLAEIQKGANDRVSVPDQELSRVLGGGIVPGSLVLIGGEPGIGKSTLMLQIGLTLKHLKILYVSGEESEQQIRMRADRMLKGASLDKNQCYILTGTDLHPPEAVPAVTSALYIYLTCTSIESIDLTSKGVFFLNVVDDTYWGRVQIPTLKPMQCI